MLIYYTYQITKEHIAQLALYRTSHSRGHVAQVVYDRLPHGLKRPPLA